MVARVIAAEKQLDLIRQLESVPDGTTAVYSPLAMIGFAEDHFKLYVRPLELLPEEAVEPGEIPASAAPPDGGLTPLGSTEVPRLATDVQLDRIRRQVMSDEEAVAVVGMIIAWGGLLAQITRAKAEDDEQFAIEREDLRKAREDLVAIAELDEDNFDSAFKYQQAVRFHARAHLSKKHAGGS